MKGRQNQTMRIVSYLCYLPKQMSSKKNNKKRIEAYTNLRTTTHWVDNVKMFAKMPRTYGAQLEPITEIIPPILSNLGMSLVGLR